MSEIRGGVPCGYPAEKSGMGVLLNGQFSVSMERIVSITRAGVVQLPSSDVSFSVNGENLEDYIWEEIKKKRPVLDPYGNFAGRVTIQVELIGDIEEENNV